MSQQWRPSYDDPDPPMPFWRFMLLMALFIIVLCAWLAAVIG